MTDWRIGTAFALGLASILSACASKPPKPVTASLPIKVIPPRPTPPQGASTGLTIPSQGANGAYVTINSGISDEQAVWHVRSALNVAALNCPGAQGKAIAASYNQLLTTQRKPLKSAYNASLKAQSSLSAFDSYLTRVYNFFAQPTSRTEFCRTAEAVVAEANATSAKDFKPFAVASLTRLEAPFLAFYRHYDDYRRNLAEWNVRYGPNATPTMVAAAAPTASRLPAQADGSRWRIQLGAFASEQGALSSWSSAKTRIAAFAALEPHLEPVPTKSLVRLQAGPLKDKEEAASLCKSAAKAGQSCLPVAPTS